MGQELKALSKSTTIQPRGIQIPGARLPGRQNLVWQYVIFVRPQYETCFMSPFRHLVLRLLPDLWKICTLLV